MSSFNKFDVFVKALAEKNHNLASDALKVYFSNAAPNPSTHHTYNNTSGGTAPAEISAGFGYVAGGKTASLVSSTQTNGVYRLILSDPTIWTAVSTTGGTIGPFRYFVLWNSTAASNNLIGWWDYGTSVTLLDGQGFLVDLNQTTGVLTLT
jgi:hypothetical protein